MAQNIEVIIQSILKDEGFKAGLKNLQGLERETKRSAAAATRLSRDFRAAGQVIAGFVGFGSIAAFTRSAVDEFARFERKINAIDLLMSNLGVNAPGSIDKIREALEDLALGGGATVDESSDAFLKFLGITGDVEAAMFATKLASSIAEGGVVNMTEATQKMEAIYSGKLRSALEGLHLNLTLTGDKAADQKAVIEALVSQYGNWGDEIQDTTGKIGSLEARWAEVRRKLGEFASKVVGPITTAFDYVVKFIEGAGAYAGIWIDRQIVLFEGFSDVLANIFDFTSLMKGKDVYFDGIAQSMERLVQQRAANDQALADEYVRIWGDAQKKVDQIAAESADRRGKENFLAGAGTHIKDEEEPDGKAAERAAKAEIDAFIDLQKAKAEALEKGSQERLKEDLRLLDMQRDRELENVDLTEDTKKAIVEKYNLEKLALHAAYLEGIHEAGVAAAEQSDEFERERMQNRLDLERELWEELAGIAEEGTQEYYDAQLEALVEWYRRKQAEARGDEEQLEKIRKVFNARLGKINRDRQKNDEETEEAKVDKQRESVKEGIAALGVLFGQQKAAAIAMAIIDTYGAATKALNNPPGPPVTIPNMLLAIATGLAQVKQIRDTERGGGFDDPINDAYARNFGGRKWARDLVDQVGMGFRSELGRLSLAIPQGALMGALAPAPVVSAGPTITENIRGGDVNLSRLMLADRRAMRRLSREVARASRLDSVRRLR